jgi:hypothetical protein
VPDPIVDDFIVYPILPQERNATVTKGVKTAALHPEGIQDEMKFPADIVFREWRAMSSLEDAARRASAQMLAKHLGQHGLDVDHAISFFRLY